MTKSLIPGMSDELTGQPVDPTPTPTSPPTTGFSFSQRSLTAMNGIHPDLRKVCDLAIQLSPVDFVITEGLRSLERQRQMVDEGKSQTMNSRHLVGCAVDYVDFPDFSYDIGKAKAIADAFKAAATQLGIPIHWGGDWKGFVDNDHIELDKTVYPG